MEQTHLKTTSWIKMRVLLVSVFFLPLVLAASQGPAVSTDGDGNAISFLFLFLFLYSPEEKGTKTLKTISTVYITHSHARETKIEVG